ncbi:hypothetical protein PHMEG_0004080 [Phytophthora megakarya]|uniref:Uncharacterized protein n=1 Tax=Phytophthora megakarya TaxID=4795 RepID=A0A225WUS5_9STRA|nr:hypothetical protein PHMEG_0004080 [Phytophthora megakarya]
MHWLSEDGSKKQAARLKRLRECIPSEVKTVILINVLTVPYCADTGADRTVMSRQHDDELQKVEDSVVVKMLASPIVNEAMGEHQITWATSVQLRLLLNTGPVTIHEPVECLEMENFEPDLILGHIRTEEFDDETEGIDGELFGPAMPATSGELKSALDKLITTAIEHGFSRELEPRLQVAVLKHGI